MSKSFELFRKVKPSYENLASDPQRLPARFSCEQEPHFVIPAQRRLRRVPRLLRVSWRLGQTPPHPEPPHACPQLTANLGTPRGALAAEWSFWGAPTPAFIYSSIHSHTVQLFFCCCKSLPF